MNALSPAAAAADIGQSHTDHEAALIKACARHPGNIASLNNSHGESDCPEQVAYFATSDLISETPARTMAGLLAKCRAVQAEAAETGSIANGPGEHWALDVCNELLDLMQAPSPDAGLIAACNEYLRIQRAFEAYYDALGRDMENGDPGAAILDPIPALVEYIVSHGAATPEGQVARLRCAAFHYLPKHPACRDEPDWGNDDRFRAATLRDLVYAERGATA